MITEKPLPCSADLLLEKHFSKEVFSPGFERVRERFKKFVNASKNYSQLKIITVAGTNGKGEVCFSLAHLLSKSNKKFYLWSSPHLLTVKERFLSHMGYIETSSLLALLKKNIKQHSDLSYYEILFFCFCEWVFEQTSFEEEFYLILEVGLGGRLDAVNVFDADVMSVVSIGRDHQKILGFSLREILMEKLGITRQGKPLVSGVHQAYLRSLIKKECLKKEIPLNEILVNDNYVLNNRAISLEIARLLGHEEFHDEVFEDIFLPGRRESLKINEKDFIFIGAHNRDGLKSLFNLYQKSNKINLRNINYVICSFSERDESELVEMLRIIKANKCVAKELIFCTFSHPRALSKEAFKGLVENEFQKEMGEEKVKFSDDINQAIEKIPSYSKVLVLGSYYFVGFLQKNLLL